jgi:hypothetical protein
MPNFFVGKNEFLLFCRGFLEQFKDFGFHFTILFKVKIIVVIKLKLFDVLGLRVKLSSNLLNS